MRKVKTERKTKETQISLELNLDGTGKNSIRTGVSFLDHMLTLMARHGLMDLNLKARGDIDVDWHHTVEDTGLVLGKAVRDALGEMKGIRRYGSASVPMDEALAQVHLDISGRPYLVYNVQFPPLKNMKKPVIKDFDVDLVEDFFLAFAASAGITLHIHAPYGRNLHHIIEAVFKAAGRALMEAVSVEPRSAGQVPSTKGKI